MSNRAKRNSRAHHPAAVPEKDQFRSRREASFQLHDEADLVNFRADALNRFITNQDLLDNVVSKLLHTSRLVPPPSFPKRSRSAEKLYDEKSTDDELLAAARDLSPLHLYTGDLRLMRAKARLSAQELADLQHESVDQDVLSAESAFQKAAVSSLARAQAQCADLDSLQRLESALDSTIAEYKDRFGRSFVSEDRAVRKFSIPAQDLDLAADVKHAPANYDPRSITSFVKLGESQASEKHEAPEAHYSSNKPAPVGGQISMGGQNTIGGQNVPMTGERGLPVQKPYTESDEFMAPEEDYNEFGILTEGTDNGPEGENTQIPFDPRLSGASELPPNQNQNEPYKEDSKQPIPENPAGQENLGGLNSAVDMDDIDQFLADQNAGDDMDDMGALIDFDAPNEHGEMMDFAQEGDTEAHNMEDDPFNVDFLSSMGNDME